MQLQTGRPLKVFLSHASQDILIVRVLCDALKADGIAVWLAEDDLDPGTRWQNKIPEVVRTSDVVLVCLSEGSVNKEGYFQKEIEIALDAASEKPEDKIFLIPVKLDKCVIPGRLGVFHWVELFNGTTIIRENYLKLRRSLVSRARDVGANLTFEEKELINNATHSPESLKELTFDHDSLDFLRLKQEHRTIMEVASLIRQIEPSILQPIMLSYDEKSFKTWSRDDFTELIGEWKKRGILKWEKGIGLATGMRSIIRSYLERDTPLTAAKIHETALIFYQTRLQTVSDDRRRLIVEELYHQAALSEITGVQVNLTEILAKRLDQYPSFLKNSQMDWRVSLEQLREAIEFDNEFLELVGNEIIGDLLNEIKKQAEIELVSEVQMEADEQVANGGHEMKLSGKQFEKLQNALLNAFPQIDELERMTRFKLEVNVHEIGFGDLRNYAFKLIMWAQANGRLQELVIGARQSNPGNKDLFEIAQELNLAITNVPSKRELQRIIRDGNGLLEINEWQSRLARIEYQVCRVEIKLNNRKHVYGTGFLIGKDVVITNYHVMKYVIEKEKRMKGGQSWGDAADVVLQFDLKVVDSRENQGVAYTLEEKWLIDASTTSPFDEEPKLGESPDKDHLDYVLLRVKGCPGDETIGKSEPGAPKRGWIDISPEPYDFHPDSAVIIIQHPRAAPLKLAIDTQSILGLNENGTRVKYRTNTEPGSSGSPCFSLNWELIALHHLGDPDFSIGHQPEYNQGVPFHAIYERLKRLNLLDEIQN